MDTNHQCQSDKKYNRVEHYQLWKTQHRKIKHFNNYKQQSITNSILRG